MSRIVIAKITFKLKKIKIVIIAHIISFAAVKLAGIVIALISFIFLRFQDGEHYLALIGLQSILR